MNDLEIYLFDKACEHIQQRLERNSKEQQYEILAQLDAIVHKREPIQVHRPQERVLADIKEAIEHGGDRARTFFAHSFVSWYRSCHSKKSVQPQLHHWLSLDMNNRHLFLEMLALRDLGCFDDEALFQFERYCLSVIKKG